MGRPGYFLMWRQACGLDCRQAARQAMHTTAMHCSFRCTTQHADNGDLGVGSGCIITLATHAGPDPVCISTQGGQHAVMTYYRLLFMKAQHSTSFSACPAFLLPQVTMPG